MLRNAILWIGVALLFAPALAQTRDDQYRITPGDQIAISVLEDPGLNTSVLVRPDGRIALPLVGTILVEDQTPEQVQQIIRRALARDFVTPPTVTVSLLGLGAPDLFPQFYVLGEVARPGPYTLDRPLDLLQALALTGGPGPFAATNRIQVRRKVDGRDAVILFDYEQVEGGAVPVGDIPLRSGDVIVVPQRGLFE